MEFLKMLKEHDEIEKVYYPSKDKNRIRIFMAIRINDIRMSIQASYGHYCQPRVTLENLNDYQSMEFALIDEASNFLSVEEVLPTFSKIGAIQEYYEGQVYGYVPVELINDLYMELTKSQEKQPL